MAEVKVTVGPSVTRPETGTRLDRALDENLGLFTRLKRWKCLRFGMGDAGPRIRGESGVHAYIGKNGSGKTMCMVLDVEPFLNGVTEHCEKRDHAHNDPLWDDDGNFVGFGPDARHDVDVRVLSTVRLLDSETGKLHARFEVFDDWAKLDGLEHAVLVLDEITGVAHSRDGSSLPHDIMNRLMQMRKGDVRVLWSAPAWARADKLIREVTVAVTVCTGASAARGRTGLWASNRSFTYRTFAMEDFEEWTAGRMEKLDPLLTDYVWGPRTNGFVLYDTFQKVVRIGHLDSTGVCVACSGTRRRQECNCDDYLAHKAERRATTRELVSS